MLDPLCDLIEDCRPLLREVALSDVEYNIANSTLNDLGWRHIQSFDNIELDKLFVLRRDRSLKIIIILHVVRDIFFSTILESPSLLDFKLKVESCLCGNIGLSAFVSLCYQLKMRKRLTS